MSDQIFKITQRKKWLVENCIPQFVHALKERENIIFDQDNHQTNEQILKTLVQADPSANSSAVQWIVQSYCKEGFLWEDVKDGANSKVYQTLKWFAFYKNLLNSDDRNLYNYHKLSSVFKTIEPFVTEAHKQNNLSGKQAKRMEKEIALEQTAVILDESDLKIVIPLTQQASQWWGQGTQWCTAARESNYFESYNKDAPLIILLFKDHLNNHRKLQLWVKNNNFQPNNFQFMDETDAQIDQEFLKENYKILEPIINYGISLNCEILKHIPQHLIKKETFELICEQNGGALRFINNDFKTKDLCKIALKQTGLALRYVPQELIDEEFAWIACQQTSFAFELVPKTLRTERLCKDVCARDGYALYLVPDRFKTQELCWIACENYGQALNDVPNLFRTKDLCKRSVEQNGKALSYVPENLITQELCWIACENDGLALCFVPNKFQTEKLYWLACEQNGLSLNYVPERFRTLELCKIALAKSGQALCYVPEQIVNEELYRIACSQNGRALADIPKELKTEKLCWIACQQTGVALSYVPDNFKIEELCLLAVKQTGLALAYVLPKLKTLELCRIAYQNNEKSLIFTPQKIELELIRNADKSKSTLWNLDQTKQSILKFYKNDTDHSHTISV